VRHRGWGWIPASELWKYKEDVDGCARDEEGTMGGCKAAGGRSRARVGTEGRGLTIGGLGQQERRWWRHQGQVGQGVRLQGQGQRLSLFSL
jgi:hypothetical protein